MSVLHTTICAYSPYEKRSWSGGGGWELPLMEQCTLAEERRKERVRNWIIFFTHLFPSFGRIPGVYERRWVNLRYQPQLLNIFCFDLCHFISSTSLTTYMKACAEYGEHLDNIWTNTNHFTLSTSTSHPMDMYWVRLLLQSSYCYWLQWS